MHQAVSKFAKLSRARQLILVGGLFATLSVFMPWHAIGVATLGTEHTFSGLQDQNLIIGILTLIFSISALLIVGLPLLGMRLPHLPWNNSSLITFLGGETALLTFVLIVMHTTTLTRAANYDIRFGIQLAFIASLLIFFGGNLLRSEEESASLGTTAPLTRAPREAHRHTAEENVLDIREHAVQSGKDDDDQLDEAEQEKEDRRMRLDI